MKYLSTHFIKYGTIDNISCYLSYASKIGAFEVVKYFVEKGMNVNPYTSYPTQFACENGHFEIVKYLVEKGSSIHARKNLCIRAASRNGHLDIVKFLIHLGANFRAKKDYPIRYARKNGHLHIVKYLEDTYHSFLLGNRLKCINYNIKCCSECNEQDAVNKCEKCGTDLCEGCITMNDICDTCYHFDDFA